MKGIATERDPRPLQEAALLVSRVGTTGCSDEDLADVRRRLQCLAAHPSCDTALGERVAAAILVLDLIRLGSTAPPANALAS